MGRFGNVFLVGGETDPRLDVCVGEVIRLYLTNTANTRVFNVGLPGARMKLVGGDSGRCEQEEFVDSVVVAPSERVVVDVLLEHVDELTLEHRTPTRSYSLATIDVAGEHAVPSLTDHFERLRQNPEWLEERARLMRYLDAPPDKTIAMVAEMDLGQPEGPVSYACPMHPDVVRDRPERCPKCGMKLVPAQLVADAGAHGGHGHGAGHAHADHGGGEGHGDDRSRDDALPVQAHDAWASGIEWEDDMVDVNRLTTPSNMRWNLIDRETGAVNGEIDCTFRVGEQVKLRLVNEMDSDHAMHHPFHIHGAGRFVVLARDEVSERNLVWKDTVLVRTGETVDVLLDVTNPGRWMMHCHIAEHHESGMMFGFDVARVDAPANASH
jgi:FtsP/CotA-like multicopper oxidase with cupredoxin domain